MSNPSNSSPRKPGAFSFSKPLNPISIIRGTIPEDSSINTRSLLTDNDSISLGNIFLTSTPSNPLNAHSSHSSPHLPSTSLPSPLIPQPSSPSGDSDNSTNLTNPTERLLKSVHELPDILLYSCLDVDKFIDTYLPSIATHLIPDSLRSEQPSLASPSSSSSSSPISPLMDISSPLSFLMAVFNNREDKCRPYIESPGFPENVLLQGLFLSMQKEHWGIMHALVPRCGGPFKAMKLALSLHNRNAFLSLINVSWDNNDLQIPDLCVKLLPYSGGWDPDGMMLILDGLAGHCIRFRKHQGIEYLVNNQSYPFDRLFRLIGNDDASFAFLMECSIDYSDDKVFKTLAQRQEWEKMYKIMSRSALFKHHDNPNRS